MLDTEKLLSACIRKSNFDDVLLSFFASPRAGIIYGAGKQASFFYSYWKLLFDKSLKCFMTSKDNDNLSLSIEYIPEVYTPALFAKKEDISNFDIILCVHESNYRDIKDSLRSSFSQLHLYEVVSWEAENEKLAKCYGNFYNMLLKYEKKCKHICRALTQQKKLFIHAGMPKTASTTLQGTLFKNRNALLNANFYYPKPFNGCRQHAELISGMYPFTHIYRNGAPLFNIYNEKMAVTGAKNIVFSSESFIFDVSVDHFSYFMSKYAVNFVIFFRNPILWAQSASIERARGFISASGFFFCDLRIMTSQSFLGSLKEQYRLYRHFFGRNNDAQRMLISYDKATESSNIVDTFSDCIGIEPSILADYDNFQENKSLEIEYALFLMHLYSLDINYFDLLRIVGEIYFLAKKYPRKKYAIFSRKQIESIPARIYRIYEQLARDMGDNDFFSRGYEKFTKLEYYPHMQLPVETQKNILEKLSPRYQEIILEAMAAQAKSRAFKGAFLPDIPHDERAICQLQAALARRRERGVSGRG